MTEDDEVTLIATIIVRYSAMRGEYMSGDGSLMTDEQMAWIDLDSVHSGEITMCDVIEWADGKQNVSVTIAPE